MLSKNSINSLVMAIVTSIVLFATASSYASVANAARWRDFGDRALYFFGSDRCPLPHWLQRRQHLTDAFSEPDLQENALAIESFFEQALEGYEPNSYAWQGRTALDVNPRCIFGLYLVDKFPGTKLAVAGKQHFERSIERSCLVVLGMVTPWQQLLEAELTNANWDYRAGLQPESFDRSEVPFLLIYLMENGSSEVIRQQARKQLAGYLWQRYGLEPALRQYSILLEQGRITIDEQTCLEVAKQLAQTGAICDAQQLYERILQSTDLSEIAMEAAKNLVRIKLANSQQIHAWEVLDVLRRRFPDIEPKSEDLKDFLLNFQINRQERLKQLVGELLIAQRQEEALQLCRLCNDLWKREELLERWQNVIDSAEPGGLAHQCARLYLARNLVDSGKVNEAKDMLDGLCDSIYPAIRARALLVLADTAQSMGRTSDALALYQQAAQLERPTVLPQWFKAFQIKQLDAKKLSVEQSTFFASLLAGYNELVDGNFEAGAGNLLKGKQIASSILRKPLLDNANKSIPAMLMLAYAKMGDYARAEEYGLEAIRGLQDPRQDSKQSLTCFSQIERADNSLFDLLSGLRALQGPGLKSPLERYASNVYTAVTVQSPLNADSGPTESALVHLFWQIKRQRVGRLLSAEYDLAKARLTGTASFKEFPDVEPIIFAAQLLSKDSFEQISGALGDGTPQKYAKGQMYRFARFAQQVGQPNMTRMALNVAAQQVDSASGNVELLNSIADMYLKGNSHQMAIEIYGRIVEEVADTSEAQKAQFEIIKIYAEQLKLYDKAIQECQKFLKKFSDSTQVSEVEFLIGKLAYLNSDYAGATGQLDSFQRKYPHSPQVGQAMMFAALSRMSEGASDDAIDRFTEIVRRYPNSDLAARSKLLIGYAQVSGQKYSQALETFRQLVEQYPKSQYVEQAKGFIERLSKFSP